MKKSLSLLLVLMVLFTGTVQAKASPVDKIKANLPKESITINSSTNDLCFSPSQNVTNKEEYAKKIDELTATPMNEVQALDAGGIEYLSDEDSLPYSDGNVYSQFYSRVYWDLIKSSEVSGNSRAAWSGGTPMYCNTISLSDKINFIGAVVSVSASGPNWETGLQTATWTQEMSNSWQIDHAYSNVTCVGYDIYIKQTTTGEFQFGTSNYTTNASDSI